MDIDSLKKTIEKELEEIKNLKELKEFSSKYLGKKGEMRKVFAEIKNMPIEKKKTLGKEINEFVAGLEKKTAQLYRVFQENETESKKINLDLLEEKIESGHLHPLTIVRKEIEDIFQLMGFTVVEGWEVEDQWHNFDSLNIPKGHPARDALSLGKTLYLRNNLLLRSHTSPAQTRYMKKLGAPLRIIIPGRVFRYERTDASHETNFYQIEGLMVDENVSAANLKGVLGKFLEEFFGKEVKIRFRPSYFPFTEPSFEIDISCSVCNGVGCPACKKTGWVEILGSGMVHPQVIENGKLDSKKWNGFAFGLSIDRLAMMKYKIDDIRWFYNGNLKFLKQF
ncbi:MAG TPA: phenylalanine--tRNA ligase subunit alpha [Candidatus Pacearchaeota archaeon]|nr:phenylalanine--tRNA ligase subunit alpha [Candidatus Pacearchaeota archaeon]